MSMNGPRKQVKKYDDGRTKQSFCDECNINMIMDRAAQGGTISHLNKYEPMYADYSDFDFQEHTQRLAQGQTVFDDLPAETRREFGQSPQAFFDYVNDPANINDLAEKLPELAKPGTQLPRTALPNADLEAAEAVQAAPAAPAPAAPAAPAPDAPAGV